ncbi:hypothetical protein [Vannielia litorea]|uniref:Uncharacterized protein n=1 Tax=Vannielia litorea TaxID=1217970 RepID=A0A1N6IG95_9RHOB|nr:hypothetical protein [Vannielia litorea]SIO30979.1 hypothetical protein SAMN05444002_3842 [Vannielia litorea]
MIRIIQIISAAIGVVGAVILAIYIFQIVKFSMENSERRANMLRSHLTLYIGEPLLTEGGTVIVASIPIPEEEWRALEGPNPAAEDEDNRKRPQLKEGDRLFGAYLNGRVNFVEMYYPEGGTYGFDLVSDPRLSKAKPLESERIGVGSGKSLDPESGEWVSYDASTLVVRGPKASSDNARLIRVYGREVKKQASSVTRYEGVTVYEPTMAQVLEATSGEYSE